MKVDTQSQKRMAGDVLYRVVLVRRIRVAMNSKAAMSFCKSVEIGLSPAYILCPNSV